jgi:hypothetical protein
MKFKRFLTFLTTVFFSLILDSCADQKNTTQKQRTLSTVAEPDANRSVENAGKSSASGSTASQEGEKSSATPEPETTASPSAKPSRLRAGGIRITSVIANQAVDCPLAVDRKALAPESRSVPLISNREMLIRIDYRLDQDFKPRNIEGILTLTQKNGTTHPYSNVRKVETQAAINLFGGTFQWLIEASHIQPGTSYDIVLYEDQEATSTQGDPAEARFPGEGEAALGVWSEPMVLDLVLVPFTCDNGTRKVDLSEKNLTEFKDYIYSNFPIHQLNLQVHKEMASATCSEFDAAEHDLPALRLAEKAPPYVYYGGLLPGGGAGYSVNIEGSDQKSFRRTFASHVWRNWGLSPDLWAHELGHNHGRPHSFEDPSYPVKNSDRCGLRREIGFGIRSTQISQTIYSNDRDIGLPWIDPSQQFLAPTRADPCYFGPSGNKGNFNDIMSYAYPFWVSAYTYKALAERIRLIASWKSGLSLAGDQLQGTAIWASIDDSRVLRWTKTAGEVSGGAVIGTASCVNMNGHAMGKLDIYDRSGHQDTLTSQGSRSPSARTVVFSLSGEASIKSCRLSINNKTYILE